MRTVLLLLLGVSAAAQAGPAPADPTAREARSVLEAAAEAQGTVHPVSISDAYLHFEGRGSQRGRDAHAIVQEYWYRKSDRSFRIRTASSVLSREWTEQGIFAGSSPTEYWEHPSGKPTVLLSPGNSHDLDSIHTIRQDRENFETILHLVFLSRLLEPGNELSMASSKPVRLLADQPHEARSILGKKEDRPDITYDAVDVKTPKKVHLRLFIRTDDHTVRKAVTYAQDAGGGEQVAWVYYFGFSHRRDPKSGLLLPAYVSMHDGVPLSEKLRDSTARAWGLLKVSLNTGLDDGEFAPPK